MYGKRNIVLLFVALIAFEFPNIGAAKKGSKTPESKKEITGSEQAILWINPQDISSRNLYYGPGGERDAPHTTFTFLKEDLDGSNPKFDVRDENGVKWKVK